MAEVVAATHDAHEARDAVATDTLRDHVAVSLGSGKVHVDGLVAQFGLCDKVWERQVAVRSTDDVSMVVGYQVVLDTLRHAAEHTEEQLGAALRLALPSLGIERVEAVVNLALRILSDRAGVEEDGVGLLLVLRSLVARHLHDRGDDLGVGHVHLAAVGFYE